MSDIKDIVRTFKSRGQFKGLGGELMKQACAVLIKKCSIVHFPIHLTDIVGKYNIIIIKMIIIEISFTCFNIAFVDIINYCNNIRICCE